MRHRATVVGASDRRVAGFYEQCIGEVETGGTGTALARVVGSLAGLGVSGLVGRTGRLTLTDLRDLAGNGRLTSYGEQAVDLIDLMTAIRPSTDADVLVFETLHHGEIALPIAKMLAASAGFVQLGRSVPGGGHDWHAPLCVHADALPEQRPVDVAAVRATTFLDFVRSPK